MDGEHLLPFGEVELVERRHDLDAGVADQDVDAAEGRDRLGDAGFDLPSSVTSIATPIARRPGRPAPRPRRRRPPG